MGTSATGFCDNHGGKEHTAEALVPEIRGEAEAKESCAGQPSSGEQQQQEAAQGTCGRRRGPVERKKLKTHSWWVVAVLPPCFSSIGVMQPASLSHSQLSW